ncbi:MAG: hypothetical protein KIT43_14520 [Bauldia sp.]|nr:hypothetical protein [Bauldia sp.]MCW5716739.1 hypothetical protein [Bauldia sp.]
MTLKHDLAPLAAQLALARRRVRLNLSLDAAVRGAASGAGLWVFLEAIRRNLPDGFRRMMDAIGLGGVELPLRQAMIASIVVAVVVALSIGLAALARSPGEGRLAQRADRAFGLRERLSTALEVAGSGAKGPIETALLRDATTASASVDIRRLERLRLPSPVWLLAVFLAVGLVLQLAPVTQTPPRAAGQRSGVAVANAPSAPAPLTAAERTAIVAEIQRAAEAIRTEAALAADPTLEGVGRTLEGIGNELAAGADVDRDELMAELGALLDYAAPATSAALPPDAPIATATATAALEALMAAVDPAARTATPQLTTGPGEDNDNAAGPLFDEDHQPPTVVGRTAERGVGDGTRQAPTERMQGNVGGIQVQLDDDLEGDDVVNEARAGGIARPNAEAGNLGVETAPQPRQRTAAGPGLGDNPPPNGGTQRTELAGETPGGGVQADNPFPTITSGSLEYEIDHGMELAGAVNPQGRRIQIDIPPTPQEQAAAALAPEAAAAWRRIPEAAIARLLLDPAARDFVARYFGVGELVAEAP